VPAFLKCDSAGAHCAVAWWSEPYGVGDILAYTNQGSGFRRSLLM